MTRETTADSVGENNNVRQGGQTAERRNSLGGKKRKLCPTRGSPEDVYALKGGRGKKKVIGDNVQDKGIWVKTLIFHANKRPCQSKKLMGNFPNWEKSNFLHVLSYAIILELNLKRNTQTGKIIPTVFFESLQPAKKACEAVSECLEIFAKLSSQMIGRKNFLKLCLRPLWKGVFMRCSQSEHLHICLPMATSEDGKPSPSNNFMIQDSKGEAAAADSRRRSMKQKFKESLPNFCPALLSKSAENDIAGKHTPTWEWLGYKNESNRLG